MSPPQQLRQRTSNCSSLLIYRPRNDERLSWPSYRWGPSSPSVKGAQLPIFGPYPLWPNGWMDQAATWYEGRLRPRPDCVTWRPSSNPSPKKGTAPNFRPMSIVAKWSPISATAEHLLPILSTIGLSGFHTIVLTLLST